MWRSICIACCYDCRGVADITMILQLSIIFKQDVEQHAVLTGAASASIIDASAVVLLPAVYPITWLLLLIC
jgi:hypothetical protein